MTTESMATGMESSLGGLVLDACLDDKDGNNDNNEADESVIDTGVEEDELDAELDLESQDNKDVVILY